MPKKPKNRYEWVFALVLFVFFVWLGQLDYNYFKAGSESQADLDYFVKRAKPSPSEDRMSE